MYFNHEVTDFKHHLVLTHPDLQTQKGKPHRRQSFDTSRGSWRYYLERKTIQKLHQLASGSLLGQMTTIVLKPTHTEEIFLHFTGLTAFERAQWHTQTSLKEQQ